MVYSGVIVIMYVIRQEKKASAHAQLMQGRRERTYLCFENSDSGLRSFGLEMGRVMLVRAKAFPVNSIFCS